VTGEGGGKRAKILLYAMGIGIVLDFLALNLKLWRDVFSTAVIGPLHGVTENLKTVFQLNTSAAILGLATSSHSVRGDDRRGLAPFILGAGASLREARRHGYEAIFPGRPPIAGLGWEGLFYQYARYIGIGGIFAAGVISIHPDVAGHGPGAPSGERRDPQDDRPPEKGSGAAEDRLRSPDVAVMGGVIVLAILLFLYFRFAVLGAYAGATGLSLVALLITLVIAFLFAAVSSWAVATISITPVSGMTLTTLIVSASS